MLKFIGSASGAFAASKLLPTKVSVPLVAFFGIYSAYKKEKALAIGATVGAISAMVIKSPEVIKEKASENELQVLARNNAFIYIQRNGDFTEGILIRNPVIINGKIAIDGSSEFLPLLRIGHGLGDFPIKPTPTEAETAKNIILPFSGKIVIMVNANLAKTTFGGRERNELLANLKAQGIGFTEFTKQVPELVRVPSLNKIEGNTATQINDTFITPTLKQLTVGRKVLYLKSNLVGRSLFLINKPFFSDGKLIMDSNSPLLMSYNIVFGVSNFGKKQAEQVKKLAGDGNFLLVFDNNIPAAERDVLRKALFVDQGMSVVQFHGVTPEIVIETTFEDV